MVDKNINSFYKVFNVIEGTEAFNYTLSVLKNNRLLPSYETNLGIVEFCDDMEIFVMSGGEIYLIIGSSKIDILNNFERADLLKVTIDEFKEIIHTGSFIHGYGTGQFKHLLGNKVLN